MLTQAPVTAAIPVVELDRAKKFYVETLGLELLEEHAPGNVIVGAGEGSRLSLYQREPHQADHALATFYVQDIEEEVADLAAKGVEFVEYHAGPIQTENFIATLGDGKAAWFKDSEGNVLNLMQRIQE